MITSWDIYWITRLDGIHGTFAVTALIVGVVLVAVICFSPIILDAMDEDNRPTFIKALIISACVFFLLTLGSIFTPTTKEFAAIYLIPKIANNEQMQKIPDNAAKLLNKKLEEWIADTTDKKSK